MKKCSRCGRLGLFFFIDADGFCEKCAVAVKRQQEKERELLLEKEREQQLAEAQARLEVKRQQEAERALQLEKEREQQLIEAQEFIEELAAACAVIPKQPRLLARADSEDFSLWLGQRPMKELSEIDEACEKICTLLEQRRQYPRLWDAFLLGCIPADGSVGYVYHPQIYTNSIHPQWGDFSEISTDLSSNAKALREQVQSAKNFESLEYKVVGVTYKNGRRSRQTILKQIHFRDPPYQKTPEIRIEECEYEGEPAFAVYADEEQVGFIGRDDIPEVLERWDRYRRVKSFEVRGGDFYYGMKICVEFYR